VTRDERRARACVCVCVCACVLRTGSNQSSHSFYFDSFVNSSSLYSRSIWPPPNAISQVMPVRTAIISYLTLPTAKLRYVTLRYVTLCYFSSHHETWLQFIPTDWLYGYLDCSLSLFCSVVSAVDSNITFNRHNQVYIHDIQQAAAEQRITSTLSPPKHCLTQMWHC
jgi:hypothetical protein